MNTTQPGPAGRPAIMQTGLSSPSQWDADEPSAAIWKMVEGLDVDVDQRPDGIITVTSRDGQLRMIFGASEPAVAGEEAEGWDWTSFSLDDGEWMMSGGDWEAADADMAAVLRGYFG